MGKTQTWFNYFPVFQRKNYFNYFPVLRLCCVTAAQNSITLFPEATVRRCSSKWMFLKFLQNSQENTCEGSFFNKVTDLKVCNFIKKRLQHRCFPVNILEFSRSTFFIEYLWSLVAASVSCSLFLTQKLWLSWWYSQSSAIISQVHWSFLLRQQLRYRCCYELW